MKEIEERPNRVVVAKIEEEGGEEEEVLVRLGEVDGMKKKGLESLGGKGKNLALLAEAGFPVPTAFCLTAKAFKDHLEDVITLRKDWNSSMNGNGDEERRLEGLQEAIRRTEIRTTTRNLIKKTIEKEFEDELAAVRSSATAEDLPSASFAGQHDTYLGVRGFSEIEGAIKDCWASLFHPRAVHYRKVQGLSTSPSGSSSSYASPPPPPPPPSSSFSSSSPLSLDDLVRGISMCVVIQKLVKAKSAGVLFTTDVSIPSSSSSSSSSPSSSSSEERMLITSSWGLGESVVSSHVTPDTFLVRKPSSSSSSSSSSSTSTSFTIVSRNISKKLSMHVPISGGSQDQEVPPGLQEIPSLDDTTLLNLCQVALKIEQHFEGTPQDIEFAIGEEGQVFILQSRAITTLHLTSILNELDDAYSPTRCYAKYNIGEMIPLAITPLTKSTFTEALNFAFCDFYDEPESEEGEREEKENGGERKRHRFVSVFYGHAFFDLTRLLEAGSKILGFDKRKFDRTLCGKEVPETVAISSSEPFWRRFIFTGKFLGMSLFARHWVHKLEALVSTFQERYFSEFCLDDKHYPIENGPKLFQRIDEALIEFRYSYRVHYQTSSCSGISNTFLTMLIGESSVAGVLSGIGGVDSAGVLNDLYKMTRLLEEDPTMRTTFLQLKTNEEVFSWLKEAETSKKPPALLFKTMLLTHGHRCYRESEMRQPGWSDDPISLVKTLQNILKSPSRRSEVTSVKSEEEANVEALARLNLNFIQKTAASYLLPIVKDGIRLREHTKYLTVKLQSVLKLAYRKLATYLTRRKLLLDDDLIYFLTHPELRQLIHSPEAAQTLVRKAVQRRHTLPRQMELQFKEVNISRPVPLPRFDEEEEEEEGNTSPTAEGYQKKKNKNKVLKGTPVSAGVVTGKARVARSLEEAQHIQPGEILIVPFTDVAWTPLFAIAGGLATEIGGVVSHGAVVAREYALPCIVAVPGATRAFCTGETLRLNGDTGTLSSVTTTEEE